MKRKRRDFAGLATVLFVVIACVLMGSWLTGCDKAEPRAVRERIAIYAREDSYVVNGKDILFYSDDRSTGTITLDGAGAGVVSAGYITATTSITGVDITAGDDLVVTDDATVSGDLTVTGSTSGAAASFTGNSTIGDYVIYTEQTVVACSEGAPITATGTYQPITSTAAITTSTSCAVVSGTVTGQVVWLVNENAADNIIVDDGANTDLGGNVTLGAGDILKLLWNGVDWLGLGTANN